MTNQTDLAEELAAAKINALKTAMMIGQGLVFALAGAGIGYSTGGKAGAFSSGFYAFAIYILANMQRTGGVVPTLEGLKK
jgi:hypothetical protein